MTARRWRGWPYLGWLVLAGPALAQLALLAIAVAGRFGYPYDLEWMEGGLLHHAQRLSDGDGLYGPPSISFIPYLYTPLYPGLLAVLGDVFGLSYQLGRAISVLSLVGIAGVALAITVGGTRGSRRAVRAAGLAGGLYAIGLFAAGYPYVEGWYDLVRADTLFLFMVTGGLALAHATVRTGEGWAGHGRTAAAAAVLALSFFCKQTGIAFVAAGGVIVVVGNWRRIFVYVVVAGAIGLGGTLILQRATGGWFWIYAYKVHQAHDWNKDRYWMSFGNIAKHLPVVSALVQVTLVVVLATWVARRRLPREGATFLVWTFVYLVSIELGATSWATEFAHFNAYMPAMLHGAIAAGCALPALAACVALLVDGADAPRRRGLWVGQGVAGAAVIALGAQCVLAWWHPSKYVPKASDKAAGDALIAHLRAIDGKVWIPSHPWYAHLAGKDMYVHRMGIKDVTTRQSRKVIGLDEALRTHKFAAIVLDNRDIQSTGELTAGLLAQTYQLSDDLPKNERPRTYTGADVRPSTIWVPIGPPAMPPGARVVFDFEGGGVWPDGWTHDGTAWGAGPVNRALPSQGPVRRAGGRWWLSSMHGGDAATGTATSPPFAVDGDTLMLRLGGGTGADLRVELVAGGVVVRTIRAPQPDSDRFRDVSVDVASLRGAEVQLRVVDAATGAWGHLNVDEVWVAP